MDGNDKFWSRWKAELTTTLGVLPMYKKNAQQWATKVGRRTLVK